MRINTVNTVEVAADDAWEIIAERFGDAAEWVSSLSSSHLDQEQIEVGASRIGQLGKRQLREQVTRLDRGARVFSYELIDPPGAVLEATNTWSVSAVNAARSEVESELNIGLHKALTPLSPLVKLGLKRQLTKAFDEFRVFAETGAPHPRKLGEKR